MGWKDRMQAQGLGEEDMIRNRVNDDILESTKGAGPRFFSNPRYGNALNAQHAYQDWRKGLNPGQTQTHEKFLYPEGVPSVGDIMGAKKQEILNNDMRNPAPQFPAPQMGPGGSHTDVAMSQLDKLPKREQARRLGLNHLTNSF